MIAYLLPALLAGVQDPPPQPRLPGTRLDAPLPDRLERDDPARQYRARAKVMTALTPTDRVYRGGDGRYYCKRGDGSVGLVAEAKNGEVYGNTIEPGHSRTVATMRNFAGHHRPVRCL